MISKYLIYLLNWNVTDWLTPGIFVFTNNQQEHERGQEKRQWLIQR